MKDLTQVSSHLALGKTSMPVMLLARIEACGALCGNIRGNRDSVGNVPSGHLEHLPSCSTFVVTRLYKLVL